MAHEMYDAVVVGGGPAGSAAAYTLASAGKSVCLIDKAVFPRDKLCGGGLTFRSKLAFERVFRRKWNPALFNASRNVSLFSQGRFLAALKINTDLHFTARLSFDHYLLDLAREAGAAARLGDGIRTLDLTRSVAVLSSGEEVAFRFLIGADGVNSMVARTLFGRSFDPNAVALALEAEVPRERLPAQGDRVEFDFSAARWGYGWVFPKRDTLTIGIGGLQRLNPDLRDRLERYFRGKGLEPRDYKVKGHFIPIGDPRAVPGRGNVLLCGDAAGAVDPISGEGLHFAMQTGGAAGAAVAEALSHPERDALEIYKIQFAPVAQALRRGRFWCWFIYPRLMQQIFAAALRWEPLRKWILTA